MERTADRQSQFLLLVTLVLSVTWAQTLTVNSGARYGNYLSCTDVMKASLQQGQGTANDGEYLLNIPPYGAVSIFCTGFNNNNPREYLTLVSGRSTNFAEIYRIEGERDSCQEKHPTEFYNSGGRSEFYRLRVNLPQLTVELEDPTFTATFGMAIGYGTAGDLYSWTPACGPMGRFSIDLRGTPFIVSPNVTWHWEGHYADDTAPGGQPIIHNGAYMGCFRDAADRALPSQKLQSDVSHMTPAKCIDACSSAGFRYAGIEYAQECFCGDSYGKHGRADKESECNMVCTGDRTSSCGGSWRLSVYDTVKGQTVSGQCGGYPGKCYPVLGNQSQPAMQLAVFPQHPCLRRPCQQNEVCVLLTAEAFKCVPSCNNTWCDIAQQPVVVNSADCPMGMLPVHCRCTDNTCVGARFDSNNQCLASTGKPQLTCIKGDPGTLQLSDVQGSGGSAQCPNRTALVGCSYWDNAHSHQGNGAGTMATATGTCSVTGCSSCTVYARCLAYVCGCENGATCDPITGRCFCPPGYYGGQCQMFDYCAYVENQAVDHAPACSAGQCQAIPQTDVRTIGGSQSDTCVFPFSVSATSVDSHSSSSAYTYTQCVDDNLVGPPFACATYFDGVDDYVDVGTWSPGPVYTLAAWVSPSVSDSTRRVIVGAVYSCQNFGLAVQGGRFVALYSSLSPSPSGGCGATLQGPLYDVGTWHLLAVSCNGSHLELYVDSVLQAHTPIKYFDVPSAEGFAIGNVKSTTNQNFRGYIKSVKVWKRSLTVDEIQNSMDVLNISTSTSEALHEGLVSHYEFGQTVNMSCQGEDHGGDDWVLMQDQEVSGVHCNINAMTIHLGITVTVAPYDGTKGGSFEVYAEEITIDGYLTAVGSGYRGGQSATAAGQSGLPGESYHTYNSSSQQNINVQAQFFQAHRGGGGGGAGSQQSSAYAAPGGGGGYGSSGGSAQRNTNAHMGQGGQTYGSVDLQQLYLGSGGGSGGNAASLSDSPAGGNGGNGGGAIGLYARGKVRIRGHVSVAGQDGRGDIQQATGCSVCPSACGNATDISHCYGNSRSACWDKSGPGGGGSGGSLYIRGTLVDVGIDTLWMQGGSGGMGGAGGCGGDGGAGRMRVDAVTLRGQVPAACKVNMYNSTTMFEDLSVRGQKLIQYSGALTWGNEVYLGCFEDSGSDRHFAYTVPVTDDNTSKMTPQYCMNLCRQKGYAFSATEFGRECFCDNAFKPSLRRRETDCDQACSGDARQKCGRGLRMSVYGPKPFLPANAVNGALQQCRPWCLTGNLYSQTPSWGYCDLSSQTATSYSIRCQCPPGFEGASCAQPCPQGTWGLNCLKSCICNSTNTISCEPQDGTCTCVPGVQGDSCDLPCKPGYFGHNCATRCSCPQAANCDSVTGQCICRPGWHGDRCQFPCPATFWGRNCSKSCSCNQGSCSPEDGACSCDPGYKLPTCSEKCDPTNYGPNCMTQCDCHGHPCDPISGTCKCSPGFLGVRCEKICPYGTYGQDCLQQCACQNKADCDPITGKCLCAAGWTGLHCNVTCAPFRFGPDCTSTCQCVQSNSQSCDRVTGVCLCKPGLTREQCDLPCPEGYYGAKCANRCMCYNNAPCDKRSGQCQCPPGVMGTSCEVQCPPAKYGPGCGSVCNSCHAGFCSKTNGSCVCTSGSGCQCPAGLLGAQCDHVCPCVHGVCDSSGHCQCDPGWQGVKCDMPCAGDSYGKYCLSMCQCQQGTCNPEDGSCTCLPGYHGDICNILCPSGRFGENCAGQCQPCGPGAKQSACDPLTGTCVCLPGFSGLQCNRPCPIGTYGISCSQTCNCVNGGCNNVDGTCECDPGFTGLLCTDPCSKGTWGQGCNHTCQCQGHWAGCDPVSGQCQCQDGFTGVLCRETCTQGMYGADCASKCSCDLTASVCSPVDGSCECLPGFQGPSCQACPSGWYGVNCSQPCECSGHGSCDYNGVCDCDVGYQGYHCETQCEQNLNWGKNCRMACDCSHQDCDFRYGICRCDPGKQGRRCDKTCQSGYFGFQCGQVCRCQNGATCDPVTGQCHCPEGVDGSLCDQPCPTGQYGNDCSVTCPCAPLTPCDRHTGQCFCPPGFMGSACNISCPVGQWDVNCAMRCPLSCTSGCMANTGQCKCTDNSCPPGYFCHPSGLCNINAMPSKSSESSSGMGSGQVAGVAVGVVMTAVVTGVVVFLVMRYCQATVVDRLLRVFRRGTSGQAERSSVSDGTDNPVYFARNTNDGVCSVRMEMSKVESNS